MKRGDRREIEVDGRKLNCAFLGAGQFCRAWRADDGRVYLIMREGADYAKELLCAGPCSVSPSPHFPPTTKHEPFQSQGKWWDVYSMPYYASLTRAAAEAWTVFKILAAARDAWFSANCWSKPLAVYGYDLNRAVVEATRGKVPESVTLALDDLANAACNYGAGMTFEFAARNLGVDEQGRIVFRDCIYDARGVGK